MYKVLPILIAAILSPVGAHANYFVSDYDPDYVPYNLQEVIDSLDYDSCVTDLRDFDNTYEEYLALYGTPISVGDTLDVNFGALKEVYEEEFRQCLVQVRAEVQRESVRNCDFDVIESLNFNDERNFRSQIRECENLRAIEICDFDYFKDEMDGSELFAFRNEIDVCESQLEPPVKKADSEPVLQVTEEKEEVVPEVKPVQVSVPAYVPPTPPPPPSVTLPTVSEERSTSEVKENELEKATSTEPETFVMTQEEIDAIVEQRLEEANAQNQVQQETRESEEALEKPNFFKRVWNFFTSWF